MSRKQKVFRLVTSLLTLFVLMGIVATALYIHAGSTAKAAPIAYNPHLITVNPSRKMLGTLNQSTIKSTNPIQGEVLFACQDNFNPFPILCYGPDQIRQAYGVNALLNRGITGKGASITIIDAFGSPTIAQDLKTFDAAWGLPDPTFNVITPFGVNGSDPGWALETTLDVEYSHAMAPGATINLVVATTNMDADIFNATKYAVDHNIGDDISQSFGENESCVDPTLLKNEHALFQEATEKGMTLFASSGDSGSAQLDCTTGTTLVEAVSSPASDPLVTAVGGTALTADAVTGNYIGETAWNEPEFESLPAFGAASGGGFSVLYQRPDYQSGVTPASSGRGVPDVAINASGIGGVLVFITDFTNPSVTDVFIVEGTSIGSPEWAGIVADGVQLAGHRLGFLNPTIYHIGKIGNYFRNFNDITSGNNILPLTGIAGFHVENGWDPVTGWGSPIANHLLAFLG